MKLLTLWLCSLSFTDLKKLYFLQRVSHTVLLLQPVPISVQDLHSLVVVPLGRRDDGGPVGLRSCRGPRVRLALVDKLLCFHILAPDTKFWLWFYEHILMPFRWKLLYVCVMRSHIKSMVVTSWVWLSTCLIVVRSLHSRLRLRSSQQCPSTSSKVLIIAEFQDTPRQ